MQEVTKKIKTNVQNAAIGMISKFQIRCFHIFDRNIQILTSKIKIHSDHTQSKNFSFPDTIKNQTTNKWTNQYCNNWSLLKTFPTRKGKILALIDFRSEWNSNLF